MVAKATSGFHERRKWILTCDRQLQLSHEGLGSTHLPQSNVHPLPLVLLDQSKLLKITKAFALKIRTVW
jgi:hypothetical protein